MFPKKFFPIHSVVFSLGLCLANVAVLQAANPRTWTDATGKIKLQAKFVSNENGMVTLEKTDGTEVEIELKKLSTTDQKFIADLEKNAPDPFKPKVDDPFKSKPAGTTKTPGGTKTTPNKTPEPTKPAGETRLIVPDYSDSRVVVIAQPDNAWKFDVPDVADSAVKAKPKAVVTPKKTDFFEGARVLVGSPSGKFAAIGYTLQKPGVNQPSTTRVVVCSLETTKVISEGSLPGKYIPLAIHNDGKQVLMKRDESGGKSDRLELWNVTAKSITKGVQWVPHDDDNGGDRDLTWGEFVGDDRMVTVSNKGRLVMWELEDIKPVYTMEIQGGSKPAISSDQKWLAFATGKEVGILDLAKGEIAALQSTPQVNWPVMAFSPGRKRLGMAAFDRLFVWDFADGELYREMPYQGLHVMGDITWPSDDHVLLGKRYLIDLENQVKLWDYQGGDFVQQIGAMSWFVVSDGQKHGALLGAQLPPPAVKDALAKALLDPEFFVLKPGTAVKIDVSGVDAAAKEFVDKALTARLKEAGYDASPNGTIDLVAQTEIKDRQVTYSTFGAFGQGQTYNVREHICRLKFVYKGQDVWTTQIGSVPGGFIRLAANETLEQYLRKSEKFYFDWFGKNELPKLLQRPAQGQGGQVQTVGTSKLTTAGVK